MLDLTNRDFLIPVESYMSYLRDSGESLTPEEVFSFDQSQFRELPNDRIEFPITADYFWVTITLSNSSQTPLKRIVSINMAQANPFQAFLQHSNGQIDTLIDIDFNSPFSARPINDHYIAYEIDIPPQTEVRLLHKLGSPRALSIWFDIETPELYQQKVLTATTVFVVLVTVVVIIMSLSLINFLFTRNWVLLLYSCREVVMLSIPIQTWGWAFQYLWPNHGAWNAQASPVFALLICTMAMWFILASAKVNERAPKLFNVCVAYIGLLVIMMWVTPFISIRAADIISISLAIPTAIAMPGINLYIYLKGNPLNKGLIAGNLVGFLTIVIFILDARNIIPVNIDPSIYQPLGMILDALFIYVALILDQKKNSENTRQIEIARQAKELYLKQASHDFLQPVTSARLMIAAMSKKPDSPEALNLLDASLLEISKILNQNIAVANESEESTIPLNAAIEECIEMYQPMANTQNITLSRVNSTVTIPVPNTAIRRVLSNLIVNAIEHANASKILIGVRRRTDAVEIWVIDNGVGMPESENSFFGSGIGLGAINKVCAHHDWKLECSSIKNKGTVFKIAIRHSVSERQLKQNQI